MNLSSGRVVICTAVLTLVLGAASATLAQDPNLDMSRPIVGVQGSMADGLRPKSVHTPNGAGFSSEAGTWIAASKFAVHTNSAAPSLTYALSHYYTSPGSATPVRYFAQVDLEPGASFWGFTCLWHDASATNNVYTAVQKFTNNANTGNVSASILGSVSSSGSFGYGWGPVSFPAETFAPFDGVATFNLYYLAVDIASDTSFSGCMVWWNRQVSPAPATASFADVPTSHPYFQFIEALRASGITAGCGTGVNYCPGDPVTRGQMAVFLARGLGLTFPY